MSGLTYRERLIFEDLFGMDSGYVLDFSNNSFARFIAESVDIDIYEGLGYEEYSSKANKLRQIWSKETGTVVGVLMEELLAYYEDYCLRRDEEISDQKQKKINEMKIVIKRIKGANIAIDLPKKSEENLQTLLEDINNSLARNKPTLVLDRLHTFATKLLRQTCIENSIIVNDEKGNYFPLHSLAGMLKKQYEKEEIFQSTFTLRALQNSISLFEGYNDIRNSKSYAHDNDILDAVEADFAVKIMANVITFIDNVESYRKKVDGDKQNNNTKTPYELPF